MQQIQKFLVWIENTDISVTSYVLTFFSIVQIRIFLENFSNRYPGNTFTTDIYTILHYSLFFFVTIILINILLVAITKERYSAVKNVTLFGLPLIWIAPIVDFIISGGHGAPMAYFFEPPFALLMNFFTFGNYGNDVNATFGLQIELIIILLIISVYVLIKTNKFWLSLISTLLIYSTVFTLVSIPSFIGLRGENLLNETVSLVTGSFIELQYQMTDVSYMNIQKLFEYYFNSIMALVFYALMIVSLFLSCLLCNKQKCIAILLNSRIERVIHYAVLLCVGIFTAINTSGSSVIFSEWINVLELCILFLTLYFAWMFAVSVNDVADIDGDRISNKHRPLVTGVLDVADVKNFAFSFLLLALIGGLIVSNTTLIIVVILCALSYVYSSKPLQLKRFPIINPFIISLAALSIVSMGFFAVSNDPRVESFPMTLVFLIVVLYTLFGNVKDIKDYYGDRTVGVYTIPVLFGEKIGKQIIASCIVIGLGAVPLILGAHALWYLFVPFSIASCYLILHEPYKDTYIFYLYFAYIASATILTVI